MKKEFIYPIIKIFVYETIKVVIAIVACYLMFSVIPLSVFLILLPVELIALLLLRNKISIKTWMAISAFVYLAFVISSTIWIMTGHTGLRFLIDLDW